MKKITRRDFIKKSAGITTGLTLGSILPANNLFSSKLNKSLVYQVYNKNAVKNYKDNKSVVREMIEEGMNKLVNKNNSTAAFKSFFSPNDVVGIKINPVDWQHNMVSHKSIVDILIEKLKSAGISENNIIIWDRFEIMLINSRYKLNESKTGVRIMATEMRGEEMESILDNDIYIDMRPKSSLGTKSYYSKILTKMCTKIINVPLLKHHRLAGITFCLKNIAYGATNNNRRFHGSSCCPFIPKACNHKIVKEKVVLNIGDALSGIYKNGPVLMNRRDRFMPKSILFSTDMVACDKIGLEIIEKKRKSKNMISIWREYGTPLHVKQSHELGIGNYTNIDHKVVVM